MAGELAQRAGLHARRVHVENEVREPFVFGDFRVGAGQKESPACPVREAGPDLLPVDHPVLAVGDGRRGQPGQVGACTRFGEQLAPDVLGGRQRTEQPPLHLVGLRVLDHRRRGHPVTHRVQRQRHGPTSALKYAVGDRLEPARNTQSAKAFGEVHPGKAGVEACAEKFGDRHRLRVVVGDDLAGEFGDPLGIGSVAHLATIAILARVSEPSITQMRQRLDGLTIRDAARLGRRMKNLRGPVSAEKLQQIATQLTAAEALIATRTAAVPAITYPDLPVSALRDEIAKTINDNQVVVIAGETGSGKTTQLPKICLELGRGIRGTIGHTQPRRLAARTVAQRIADEIGTPLGETVGYTVRFTDQVSDRTMIKLMTDGILLAEMQRDRRLLRYDTLILDEAHERSLNIDFLLGYLRELLPRRPDLKVIVTSATIEPERFAAHFGGAPIVEVSGRTYPVEIRYRPLEVAGAER